MKVLRFGRRLTPVDLERVIHGSSPTTKAEWGWTKETLLEGMFIDLSEVEFAEFTTLAQIALLIEGAVRHGVPVRITLPLSRARKGEDEFIRISRESGDPKRQFYAGETEQRILKRLSALQFMEASGFTEVIKVDHVPRAKELVEIIPDYDSGTPLFTSGLTGQSGNPNELKFDAGSRREYFLKRIFALRWFKPLYGADLVKSKNYAAAVLKLKEFGLTESDAKALAGTLLDELIENVNYYAHEQEENVSCGPFALVGAIALENGYQIRTENYRPYLRKYVSNWADIKSPVLRIVVGDSGRGIVSVLGPSFTSDNEAEIPTTQNPLKRSEKILFWSLNRWSTSDRSAALTKRGTRGLWRVQRFVRSYSGLITLRTEDAQIGVIHSHTSSVPDNDPDNLRFIPGTFIDVCILPGVTSIEDIHTSSSVDSQLLPEFTIVPCQGTETASLSDIDQALLVKHLARSTITNPKCVIALLKQFPLVSRWTQEYLSSLIRLASDLANHGALTLICPSVTWKQIAASVESLDDAIDNANGTYHNINQGQNYSDPVLLVDATGEGRWFGGDGVVRQVLTSLLATPAGKLETKFVERTKPNDVSLSRLYQKLRDQPEIVKVSDSDIQARFTVSDLNKYLNDRLSSSLKDEVEKANSIGVTEGLFRTPTLQYVSRWINVKQLIDATVGEDIVAYAIARKLAALETINLIGDISVVRIDTASAEFASKLSVCLGTSGPIYSLPGGLGAFDKEELVRVPAGKKVILIADIVFTGNTLRHALAKLIRWGVEPLGVVCIFDARKEKTYQIQSLGKGIPIISLTELDLLVDTPEPTQQIQNIDPVLRAPLLADIKTKVSYDISPDDLLQWCRKNEGAIYLGHIERPVGRHFTNYLNAGRIIKEGGEFKERILGLFIQHIIDWYEKHASASADNEAVFKVLTEIWYPAPDDFAGWIASAVKSRLSVVQPNIKVESMKGIPRAAFAGKWAFPTEVNPVAANTHVFIVDWGSLTANTIQQMMRLAAEAGASSIKAIIFLSQMAIEEEMALRRIKALSAIKRYDPRASAVVGNEQFPLFSEIDLTPIVDWPALEVTISTDVVFLSSLSLGYYMPSDCPLCDLRETLSNEAEHCPTDFLKEHAWSTYELLMSIEREEIFSRDQSDLYGERISTEDVTRVIELRQLLQTALRSTEVRNQVLETIRDLASNGHTNEKIPWLRLLSTELEWLKLPPLRFDELRHIVAKISLDVAVSPVPLPSTIIRQSILVLRAASIHAYIEHVFTLFQRWVGDKELIQELLYGIFSYLQRPYHDPSGVLRRIQSGLIQCANHIRSIGTELEHGFEYSITINSLLRVAEYLQIESGLDNVTAKDAWWWLHERYRAPMESHCEAIGCMMYVYLSVQGPSRGGKILKKERWVTTLEQWQCCQMFLAANVFPYLTPLRKLLLGEYYASIMTRVDYTRLEALYEANSSYESGMLYETEFVTRHLYEFAKNPKAVLVQEKLAQCRTELEWWNDFFLDAAAELDDIIKEEAWLLRFLRRCPCPLEEVVRAAIEEMQIAGYRFKAEFVNFNDSAVEVFCDRELLKHAVKHLIENAAGPKHVPSEQRETHNPRILFNIDSAPNVQEMVYLIVANDSTQETQPIGRGFGTLNSLLKDFGGHIGGTAASNTEWTYEARLSIRRW